MAPDFAPLTGGMIAASPSIDHLIGCAEELSHIDLALAKARIARPAARPRP
jgi:hypothetical protein